MIFEHPGRIFLPADIFMEYGMRGQTTIFIMTGALMPCALNAAVSCATGYIKSPINAAHLTATFGGGCVASFGAVVSTDGAYFVTDDFCAPGEYKSGNTCVALDTGACASGRVQSQLAASHLRGTIGGNCGGDALVANNSMYFMPDSMAPCAPGYRRVNGECTAYETGDGCPSNYYTPNDRFTRPNTTCASGYNTTDYDYCGNTIGATSNYICTPQRKCTTFGTSMLTSETGANWQLYMDMITTPSLVFESDTGNKCYMNTLPGSETDNLIIEYDNTKYHGVKE